MSGIKDQEQIDALRRRLYERGNDTPPSERHTLTDTPTPVPHTWSDVRTSEPFIPETDPRPATITEPELDVVAEPVKNRRYRSIIMWVSLFFFVVVTGLTSLYLLIGGNQISGRNIAISITGPLATGGGEIMPLQVVVTNQNKVPIESAVLIVQYPPGTKSVDEPPRDLFEERVPIDRVAAGEAINIPLRAVMFGEENQERSIRATIEYRLIDSNGTFFKEADPLVFKINSSPLLVRVEALEKVASGQEVEVKVTVQSNASTVLKDILLSATYPGNFDYTSATPAPSFRESEWLIKEIAPEGSTTITLRGLVVGQQDEEFQIQFTAGTPRQDNQFILGAVLANASTDFIIERPFIDVALRINRNDNSSVTLRTGEPTEVEVIVRNTLVETLYDMNVAVSISGNVLERQDVSVSRGYYDSVNDVIKWDVSGDRSLTEVAPGESKTFTFTINPGNQTETPAFSVEANAFARRVTENRATEQLVGTVSSDVRFTSVVAVDRSAAYAAGPIPPVADEETQYQITLRTSAGGNDVTGAVVTTALPQYVNWKNITSGDGSIVFNPVSKELTWTVGDIEAGSSAATTFTIGLLPSQNQIGTTPALLGTQRLRATDRFTGDVVRAEGVPISSELPPSSGYEEENGEVVADLVLTPNNE